MSVKINDLIGQHFEFGNAVKLFEEGDHKIYWLGIEHKTAFRCNCYLIRDGDESILIDPGSIDFFDQVVHRLSEVMEPKQLKTIYICHQDPDVTGNIKKWKDLNPEITIMGSGRVFVMLPHYQVHDHKTYDTDQNPVYTFASGNQLKFFSSPFLHSPMATTLYDEKSKYLFTGDIFAALDVDWELILTGSKFETHIERMNLFHLDYMASNIAARGYVDKIKFLDIKALLPQHGSIIPEKYVARALNYLKELKCGTDLFYAYLS